ncbi:MAG: Wax ester synthase/acyl-CoA:diacylglycerol acyltransferase [Frankiales bacterium]|nr:Wax ester synthase/acyl-CoA:diacylglycerol acyltransferase [Frankiales bacterium]
MGLMPLIDMAFMLPENRSQPMHVGGLQVFDLPAGAGPDYVSRIYERALLATDLAPAFRRRAHRGPLTAWQWTWVEDQDIDLEHHVRLSALPRPGRVRDLLALVSQLHGALLDRSRPLWEAHLIEGLEEGRFALYTKVHHAVMDGVSSIRTLERGLSIDPAEDRGMPWERHSLQRPAKPGPGLDAVPAALGEVLTFAPRLARIAAQGLREPTAPFPHGAPRSSLNVTITGSRRFAAQSWSLPRIQAVARVAGATVNDVVLAMCSTALRSYLTEQGQLPTAPLVAMTPVSRHTDDADAPPGNAVATVLCTLATDEPDAEARLTAIHASMGEAKRALAGLSPHQVTAVSGLVMAPVLLNGMVGLHRAGRPPFNLIISNIPGPAEVRFWNGARLRGTYPLSIPAQGQALNITVLSYAGEMHFGLIGCRRAVPHLQRLLAGLEDGLADLEKAYDLDRGTPVSGP